MLFDPDPTAALALLAACPAHTVTPLVPLPGLAARAGIASLVAKDETARMGLGSFKALGGAFAVAELVRARCRAAWRREPAPEELAGIDARELAAELTVVCASAGNHGLAVAAGARVFGARTRVHLARSVPEAFAERLRAAGATVVRSGAVYEDAMEAAAREVDATGGDAGGYRLVSDASWEGYVEVPITIMRGYCAMAHEMADAFATDGGWPSHVVLQAGVGGMAAAVTAHVRAHWAGRPEILVVEPDAAPCLARSVAAGRPVRAEGPVSTMGRLDCKMPSLIALEVLREAADRFVTIDDRAAETAAALLAEAGLATTPSGAAGVAAVLVADLPAHARALVIVSEGAE